MRRRIASGSELERLRRHIDNLFSILVQRAENSGDSWSPMVDLVELPDRYLVRVDLPGVSASQLDVRLANRELHVSGVKGDSRAATGRRYHRIERGVGPFSLEILLPSPVDPRASTAHLRAGVLEVVLPLLYGKRDAVHTIEVLEEER